MLDRAALPCFRQWKLRLFAFLSINRHNGPLFRAYSRYRYEAYISATQEESQDDSWIHEAHVDQVGATHAQASPSEGA